MKHTLLDEQLVHHGHAIDVYVQRIQLPDGRVRNYDIVRHRGAVTILPIDEAGNIWFVRQHRIGANIDVLELPAGMLEEGEPPDETAAREIREEIGQAAAHLEKLGEMYMVPGYSTEYMHLYLATGLSASALPQDTDEFLSTERMPVAEALRQARSGGLIDAKTICALFLAEPKLEKWL